MGGRAQCGRSISCAACLLGGPGQWEELEGGNVIGERSPDMCEPAGLEECGESRLDYMEIVYYDRSSELHGM